IVVLFSTWPAAGRSVKLVTDPSLSGPARHGVTILERALEVAGATVRQEGDADLLLVAGLAASDGPASRLLRASNSTIPTSPESLTIKRMDVAGRLAIVLCGGDERGLMYALLDTAERIGWCQNEQDLFFHVQDIHETPTIKERAISTYTMQRRYFEQRLFDEHYWQSYFDLLAASRINSFVVIFGYENGGFMAPAYPYFFDVEGFPQVEMVGVTDEQQAHHTSAFKRMIQIAHKRGVDITVGFWDHIYRGKVQGGGIPGASKLAGTRTPHVVVGVTTENLVAYNKAAMKKFLDVFPDIDGIQLRMHQESGLTRKEMPAFWHDMFAIMKRARPNLKIDLRAKGLPDPVIEDAIAQGMNFRVATKYWMEQLGLPFHPTHVNRKNQRDRRHGYADLLTYPRHYPIHWRLWSGGTARCLLWGDPDYVRRFAESAQLYQGNSFEVNEMLATKMLGEAHDTEPFQLLQAKHRYYEYEFQRYWHYYQVWGRASYNPDTPADVWQQAFERRFGAGAGKHVMNGIHLASRVLPRIVASAYRYSNFPTTRGWAEMMRQNDLPTFAKAEGSDIEQFQNFEAAATGRLNNELTTKRTPAENSRWFAQTSRTILSEVAAAQGQSNLSAKKEFHSTVTDLKILAYLAQYYAERIPAAVYYNLYLQTKNASALKNAIDSESRAVAAWRSIVTAADDVYSTDMAFGVEAVGFPRHWHDELIKLENELQELRSQYNTTRSQQDRQTLPRINGGGDKSPPLVHLERVPHARPRHDLTVVAKVTDPSGIARVSLRYRHLTQFEDYQTAEMQVDPQTGLWSGTIPGDFITPEWDLMYYLEVQDNQRNGRMAPDLDDEMPYVVVELER
ncbi:hypothetical protein ACFL6U_08945, partial [Planctomycetota bacterium]